MKTKTDIIELVDVAKHSNTYLKVCAPMVRYSKVQFRSLVRQYGTDLCFSPMILANSFCQSSKARSNEFSTTANDSPLIVQFAANNPDEFVDASQLVYPYADGVDLNCGCPQKWAIRDGVGCALLSQPEMIHKLVRRFKNVLPNDFSVSIKIRILKDLKKTIELCRQIEQCGISLLTIHGRTQFQKNSDSINVAILSEVCKTIKTPIIANGGIKSLKDADNLYNDIKCSGIMAASGLLTNPALFSGLAVTPLNCVKQWMNVCKMEQDKMTFQCYHHHLVFMLEKVLTRQQKQVFNYLNTYDDVNYFLSSNFSLKDAISPLDLQYVACQYPDIVTNKHNIKCRLCQLGKFYCTCSKIYKSNIANGKYFTSFLRNDDLEDINLFETNMFNETYDNNVE